VIFVKILCAPLWLEFLTFKTASVLQVAF